MQLRQAAEAMRRWFKSEEYQNRLSQGAGTDELLSALDRQIEGINKMVTEIIETDKRIRHLLIEEEQFNERVNVVPRGPPRLQVVKT